MAIDIYASRRTNYHKIYWWKSNEKAKYDHSDLVNNSKPSGFFYAKEENPIQKRSEIINNAFRVDKNTTMLKTTDKVEQLNVDDIIKHHGEFWRIVDLQVDHVHKQEEFCSNPSIITYITIRR